MKDPPRRHRQSDGSSPPGHFRSWQAGAHGSRRMLFPAGYTRLGQPHRVPHTSAGTGRGAGGGGSSGPGRRGGCRAPRGEGTGAAGDRRGPGATRLPEARTVGGGAGPRRDIPPHRAAAEGPRERTGERESNQLLPLSQPGPPTTGTAATRARLPGPARPRPRRGQRDPRRHLQRRNPPGPAPGGTGLSAAAPAVAHPVPQSTTQAGSRPAMLLGRGGAGDGGQPWARCSGAGLGSARRRGVRALPQGGKSSLPARPLGPASPRWLTRPSLRAAARAGAATPALGDVRSRGLAPVRRRKVARAAGFFGERSRPAEVQCENRSGSKRPVR